ncbi:MAG: trimeric intracellular cation channel family protein [Candidatus Nanopelagicales bacterium]
MPASVIALPGLFDAIAITVGGLSGALHATRRGFDVMGVLAIAFVTGLGGGIIRDLVLAAGTPAFLLHPSYLAYAAVGALIGFLFARRAGRWQFGFDALDVLTLGVWVLIGCQKAVLTGLPAIGVVFVGVLASVGGGLLRDLLCGDVPSAFRPGQWYAFAAFLAAVTYATLNQLSTPLYVDELATLVVAAALRWASLRWDLRTPMPATTATRARAAQARALPADAAPVPVPVPESGPGPDRSNVAEASTRSPS